MELLVDKLEILGTSLHELPFEIISSKQVQEDIRLKYRYLDMRNDKVKSNILLRSEILHYLRNKITINDDFYYLSECPDKYKVRVAGNRLIKYISIDELSKGMLQILKNSIGLTKEELLHETALAFGFNRNGSNISERMDLCLIC